MSQCHVCTVSATMSSSVKISDVNEIATMCTNSDSKSSRAPYMMMLPVGHKTQTTHVSNRAYTHQQLSSDSSAWLWFITICLYDNYYTFGHEVYFTGKKAACLREPLYCLSETGREGFSKFLVIFRTRASWHTNINTMSEFRTKTRPGIRSKNIV